MGKNRLTNESYFNFDLIGIVSTVKEYTLVWQVNQATGLELVKAKDIVIEFTGNQRVSVSQFQYRTEHMQVTLVKNRLIARSSTQYTFLLDELRQFDYLLKYRDETGHTSVKDVLSLLKSADVVEYAAILAPELIKARDNLIF